MYVVCNVIVTAVTVANCFCVMQNYDLPPTPEQMPLDFVAGEVSEAYPEPKHVMAGQYDENHNSNNSVHHVMSYLSSICRHILHTC